MTDVFRDVIPVMINQCDPDVQMAPPADTLCPPVAQRKQAKFACYNLKITGIITNALVILGLVVV